MSSFALPRSMAWSGEGYVGRQGDREETTEGRRDKSPCPKRSKSLTRLAFWRAWRSVACMKHGFSKQYQGPHMHRPHFRVSGAAT